MRIKLPTLSQRLQYLRQNSIPSLAGLEDTPAKAEKLKVKIFNSRKSYRQSNQEVIAKLIMSPVLKKKTLGL